MLFFPASFVFVACVAAVPLSSRQAVTTPSSLKCSNSTAATQVGSGILGTQRILTEINAFNGIADPSPIFSAQLALLVAKPIADQLGSIALFPTIASKNPPAATAVEDLTNALAKVQGFLANITVCGTGFLLQVFLIYFSYRLRSAPPGVAAILTNNTAALANANRNFDIALASLPNLGCTSTGA
ncbi:hypothetical protein B0H16DRAFT_1473972 [Mycena metata]|uniref:Uncharacterized protein n=1 Tax=Mycena metata TaxID=1033252 RepID=A0AAD7ML70_9AGAR|nr:hypothetical protein B0H16DRAFT_1473972 [Mycena metata]